MSKNILISTGGSGGHVIPAIILCDHLSENSEIIISTDKRGLSFVDKNFYNVKIIDTPRLNNFLLLPLNLVKIFFLTLKSILFLKKKKINLLISTGGYMSLPLILASKFLNIKIFLLEPNLVLGKANKFFLNSCDKIFCYTDKIKNFPYKFKSKIVIIKPLVRKEFYKNEIREEQNEKFTILVVGGSQGAGFFDGKLKYLISKLAKEFSIKIIHQTNKRNILNLKEFYSRNGVENFIFDYEKNLINKIIESDLCITRAGASTLAELSILKTPFVAVPLPSSKDNHQLENANFYKDNGCCWIIEQSFFNERIEHLIRDINQKKTELLDKKENLNKLNYQNTWINVNQKILKIINEN